MNFCLAFEFGCTIPPNSSWHYYILVQVLVVASCYVVLHRKKLFILKLLILHALCWCQHQRQVLYWCCCFSEFSSCVSLCIDDTGYAFLHQHVLHGTRKLLAGCNLFSRVALQFLLPLLLHDWKESTSSKSSAKSRDNEIQCCNQVCRWNSEAPMTVHDTTKIDMVHSSIGLFDPKWSRHSVVLLILYHDDWTKPVTKKFTLYSQETSAVVDLFMVISFKQYPDLSQYDWCKVGRLCCSNLIW